MGDQRGQNSYITPVNTILVLVNVAVYFILEGMGNTTDGLFMLSHGAMYPPVILSDGQWYRLLTAAFIHFGLFHLINNMILLLCLGSYLEREYGKVRYLILYLACAVGANAVSMVYMERTGDIAVSGGASGVVFGVIGALLFLIIKSRGRFKNLPLTRFLIMIVLVLYYGISAQDVDNAAHVGGLITGFVMGVIFFLLSLPDRTEIRNGGWK